MPWEIHSSRRVPPTQNRKRHMINERNQQDDPFARSTASRTIRHQRGIIRRPIKFRFQHDLESLWWVAVWILLYRVGGNKALQLAGKIFTHTNTPSEERTAFFIEDDDGLFAYIHEHLKFLTSTVFDVRDALIDSYTDEQKTTNLLVHEEYTTIYNQVWSGFSALIGDAIRVEGVIFQNPKNTKKRPRSESEPGDGGDHAPHITRKQCT
jgi:hypothetical protein